MAQAVSGRSLAIGCVLMLAATSPALAKCGREKGACKISGGTYHVALPENYDPTKNMSAIVALHSWGSSAPGLLNSGKMVKKFLAQGYVVVAPEGLPSLDSVGNTWDFTRKARRDNPTFVVDVADDAAKRFGLNRNKMVLAGFSIGGTMVHYTACKYPTRFLGFAPQSGNFWKPYPDKCEAGANILHGHGRLDTAMPIEGRALSPQLQQGSLQTAMDIWSKANNCTLEKLKTKGAGITRQTWSGCKTGSIAIDYYPNGHSVPQAWAGRIVTWFESLQSN